MTPALRRMAESTVPVVEQMVQVARGMPVRVGIMGISGAGKSTLLNAMASVLAGDYVHVQDAGAGFGVDRQRTLVPSVIPLVDCALDAVPDSAKNFEYEAVDFVGYRTETELMCTMQGRCLGEAFPAPTDIDGLRDAMGRPVGSCDAVKCGIVLVPATILDTFTEPPPYVVAMQNAARVFMANTSRTHVLPLILVITKVDEWGGAHGHDASILTESDGALAQLKAKASTWGFQDVMTCALGYLDKGVIDYADQTDPRVLVLKQLLVHTTRTAQLYQRAVAQCGAR